MYPPRFWPASRGIDPRAGRAREKWLQARASFLRGGGTCCSHGSTGLGSYGCQCLGLTQGPAIPCGQFWAYTPTAACSCTPYGSAQALGLSFSSSDLEDSAHKVPVILSSLGNDGGLVNGVGLWTSGQNIPRDYRLDLAWGHT